MAGVFEAEFDAVLQRFPGPRAVFFVLLPPSVADDLEDAPLLRGGFASVKVRARVGSMSWSTSVFPSREHATFLLLVGARVRRDQGLDEGGVVHVHLSAVS